MPPRQQSREVNHIDLIVHAHVILSATPFLWFTPDLVENGIFYFLLSTYPAQRVVPATMLAYLYALKFSLLLVSFVLPLAVYALASWLTVLPKVGTTPALSRRLKERGLLEPMTACVRTPDGGNLSLTGCLALGRSRLPEPSPEQLASLVKTNELELLYLHLYSMRNFNEVKDRLDGSLPAESGEVAAAEPIVH